MTRARDLAIIAVLLSGSASAQAATTFRVAVPERTPAADTIFVAGSFQGWNPGDPAHAMTRQPDGRWTIALGLPQGQPVEFKFTRGSWARVEKGASGEEIPNRTHVPSGDQTLDLTVASWADLGTITGRVDSLVYLPFLGGRRCWIYLPPGYEESTESYPVLYMHDGQNLFDVRTSFAGEWHVDEACEALIAAHEVVPIIVVGIENSAARCVEYTPWPDPTPDPSLPCEGGGADVYLTAIRDVLMPEIARRYRVKSGPGNTYMSGSSLGGLITHYAGYAYSDVWGRIAAVSTYFPWADRMLLSWAAARPKPPLQRYYQDMGTLEFGFTDANANGIDDFIEDLRAMKAIALSQGFVEGVDFMSVEGQDHTHWEYWWAQRMPDLLRFLVDHPEPVGVPSPPANARLALAAAPLPAAGPVRLVFELDRAGEARLELFDLQGRPLRRIASRTFAAGRHVLEWDGRDAQGRPVVGVLWARLTAGGRTSTCRVVRVR